MVESVVARIMSRTHGTRVSHKTGRDSVQFVATTAAGAPTSIRLRRIADGRLVLSCRRVDGDTDAVATASVPATASDVRTVLDDIQSGDGPWASWLRQRLGRDSIPLARKGRASRVAISSDEPMAAVDRREMPPLHGTEGFAGEVQPNDVAVEGFVTFAREHLGDLLDLSGQVLYSGASTFRPGEAYLLGLNPGGDPTNPAMMTIRQSLDDLVSHDQVRREWNSYLDATWKGRQTLKNRIAWLLRNLGLEPRTVAASNLIFPRSRDEKTCQHDRFADACWEVHERVLSIVQPRLVLTYGGTLYRFLAARFGSHNEQAYPSGHGNWACRSFDVRGRFCVVGLPHMSLYAIDHHPEVVAWIKGGMAVEGLQLQLDEDTCRQVANLRSRFARASARKASPARFSSEPIDSRRLFRRSHRRSFVAAEAERRRITFSALASSLRDMQRWRQSIRIPGVTLH